MKKITNFRKSTVSDLESDGLLDEATKLHVLSYHMANGRNASIKGDDLPRLKVFFQWHLDNKVPLVFHNGIGFDIPLCEKLLEMDLSEIMLIDTLGVSWYLNTGREMHGLATFLEEYGIKKPDIEDWENLTYEEYAHRCEEDVKINKALWDDLVKRLTEIYSTVKHFVDAGEVGGTRLSQDEKIYIDQYVNNSTVDEYIDRVLTFLMFKMDCARLQEKTKWKTDKQHLINLERDLSGQIEEAKNTLESVMPPQPKYTKKNFPAKPLLKDNKTLSASGMSWNKAIENLEVKDEWGNLLTVPIEGTDRSVKVISKYEAPNANSSKQIKDLLFSHGWKPKTFKYEKDEKLMDAWAKGGFKKSEKPEMRRIPQINRDGDDGKELCHSVTDLAEDCPEIMAYQKYTLVKHRLDMAKGFLRDMGDGEHLKARIGGFTNTLRVKHRELVNLPSVDKPYGIDLRGSLIAEDGCALMGSDLSSLEDRTKHHFMLPHDPSYVETMMADDYDPHILMALFADLITQKEFDDFMKGIKSDNAKKQRKAGKATNYASVYNAGAETIARSAGVPSAVGKQLFEGYWKLNWSVKKIAEEQCVFSTEDGKKWLINPVNGFAYSLRKEQDRFSTLCQGTGSFFFDMWVDNVLTGCYEEFGFKTLTGSFHDEIIINISNDETTKDKLTKIVSDGIQKVNDTFLLRRGLGCDIQYGNNYGEIH